MADHNEIRKKANRIFTRKILLNILSVVLGTLFLGFILREIQQEESFRAYRQVAEKVLESSINKILDSETYGSSLEDVWHNGNQAIVNDLALISERNQDLSVYEDSEVRRNLLNEMAEKSDAILVYGIDQQGRLLFASDPDENEVILSDVFDPANLVELSQSTYETAYSINPVILKHEERNDYQYSREFVRDGETYLICALFNGQSLKDFTEPLVNHSEALKNASKGNYSFLFELNRNSHIYEYFEHEDTVLTGEKANLPEECFEDGFEGTAEIEGREYYLLSSDLDSDTVICSAAAVDEINDGESMILFWSVTGFAAVLLMCLAYIVIVRNDFIRNKTATIKKTISFGKNSRIFDLSVFRKVVPLMMCGTFLIGCVSYYSQSLIEISMTIADSSYALDEMMAEFDSSGYLYDDIRSFYRYRYERNAEVFAEMFESDLSVLNQETETLYHEFDKDNKRVTVADEEGNPLRTHANDQFLSSLANMNTVVNVSLYNEEGRTIAIGNQNCYKSLSYDSADPDYDLWDVINGIRNSYVQQSNHSEDPSGNTHAAASFRYCTAKDENGQTVYLTEREAEAAEAQQLYTEIKRHRGMVAVELYDSYLNLLMPATNENVFEGSDLLNSGFVMLFDTDEAHTCLYSPNEAEIGRNAADFGISPNAFSGNDYYGFGRMNGEPAFEMFRYYAMNENYYAAAVVPTYSMYQPRLRIALTTAALSLFIMLILCITATFTTKEEEYLYESISDPSADPINSPIFNIILPGGRRASTVNASSRWENRRIPWSDKSPEQKLLTIIYVISAVLMIHAALLTLLYRRLPTSLSIMRYVISNQWDKGFNIFAFSACMLVLIFTFLLLSILKIPVRALTALFGTRGETLSHLLLSFIRYGGVISAIFYCLYLLGIDSMGLLASAGLLTLVIGLGAQSLIKDIIAGIFIVFEGEFRVGDIVTINGYRGRVADIGLRTTKIRGFEGNIKIFANSEISGVLNMTKAASVAASTINIEYGQDIAYVENVLTRELPLLKSKDQRIIDGPQYIGISALNDSSISLTVICWCEEENIAGVTRYLNKELLNIFYRNNISIPYSHMIVELDEEQKKH